MGTVLFMPPREGGFFYAFPADKRGEFKNRIEVAVWL